SRVSAPGRAVPSSCHAVPFHASQRSLRSVEANTDGMGIAGPPPDGFVMVTDRVTSAPGSENASRLARYRTSRNLGLSPNGENALLRSTVTVFAVALSTGKSLRSTSRWSVTLLTVGRWPTRTIPLRNVVVFVIGVTRRQPNHRLHCPPRTRRGNAGR